MLNTAKALQALGCPVRKVGATRGRCWAAASAASPSPTATSTSATPAPALRLMMGVVAGHDMRVRFVGRRLAVAPADGPRAQAAAADGPRGRGARQRPLPLTIRGSADLLPIEYAPPVASAQIKSAVLLAGLHAAGRHDRDRGASDARPHRAHAAPLRRRGRTSPSATARAPSRSTGDAELAGPRRQRAGRSELGRLPGRRRADRAGLGDHHRGRAGQPDAHRLLRDAARDGRRRRPSPTSARRAASRWPTSACATPRSRACACRPSARRA